MSALLTLENVGMHFDVRANHEGDAASAGIFIRAVNVIFDQHVMIVGHKSLRCK